MSRLETLATNITRYREDRGLTIIGMSERCGIAKSTLSVLESGKGNPTVETLWAIANALDVPFGALISDHSELKSPIDPTVSKPGTTVRLIEQSGEEPEIEVYSVEYAAGYRQESPAHPIGVKEKITVISGALLVGDPKKPKLVRAGETYSFQADIPHVYASFDQEAKAIVLIEYPLKESLNSSSIIHIDWPLTENDWDGVRAVVERLFVEVSQGVNTRQLQFHKCGLPIDKALRELHLKIEEYISSSFLWPVLKTIDVDDKTPYLAIIPLHSVSSFSSNNKYNIKNKNKIFKKAITLSKLAESPFINLENIEKIKNNAYDSSWIIRTLASEVLVQRGVIFSPTKTSNLVFNYAEENKENDDRSFSSRINVPNYGAFELLHPAYARQVVAVEEDIEEFSQDKKIVRAIDVGTGPGIPLLMLSELNPDLQIKAIEPDILAFECLKNNINNNTNIQAERVDFLKLDAQPNAIPLVTSFGASHHFNTAFMLQKAFTILEPGGLLCVADEFLPEFHSTDERDIALIKHHSAYILTAIAWLETTKVKATSETEAELYQRIQQTLTLSLIEAESGYGFQAVNRYRKLFIDIKKQDIPNKPEGIIGSYCHFFWLELQAMMAGFDYEVEQKTYPKRFLELANMAGFQLMRHRRVFATTGSDDLDGGTHVFTLQKPYDF